MKLLDELELAERAVDGLKHSEFYEDAHGLFGFIDGLGSWLRARSCFSQALEAEMERLRKKDA